jgi:hypothetical protein
MYLTAGSFVRHCAVTNGDAARSPADQAAAFVGDCRPFADVEFFVGSAGECFSCSQAIAFLMVAEPAALEKVARQLACLGRKRR